jgi:rhomboid protease GluP
MAAVGDGAVVGEADREASRPRERKASRPPRLSGVRGREVPVTSALLAANVVIAAIMALVYGDTADLGALIDFGANVKSATAAGDWWRLVSSNFLHVGLLHLALNMYGLWVLGRLVEQFHGHARMAIVYMGAGVCGAAASLWFGGPATSAGASGAIFGLLGAAVAELGLHRKHYPRRWSTALLGNLIFLAVANVGIGLMYPIIDQSAHLGGLAGGTVLGALLSRRLPFAPSRWMRGVVTALAAVAGGSLVYGAYGAATADFSATLASYSRVERELAGLVVMVPETWKVMSANQVDEPGLSMLLFLEHVREPVGDGTLDAAIDAHRESTRTEMAREVGMSDVHEVTDAALPVPAPWRSKELVGQVGSGMTGKQSYRIAVIGRELDGQQWVGSIWYPASLGEDVAPTMGALLRSARPPRPIRPGARVE